MPKKNSKVLDIGCGTGNYSVYFKEKGHDVIAIDISEAMVDHCKERGIDARLMNFADLDFHSESFDGIWAYASLFHVPKDKLPDILKQIHNISKNNSIIYLGVKQGDGEGFVEDNRYPGTKRWFSFYQDEELRELFGPLFNVKFHLVTKSNTNYLNYLLDKKPQPL
ncbi:class I SAM-dependent methyltransferase [Candidatus Woesearchaeota archaeon]|nr:class I SAM-dependent methyltransferase [Candidatus Woesearchaeota archaeon]